MSIPLDDLSRFPATPQHTTERDTWLQWRRQGIGGSDIGALLGFSRYASPWSLWADKTGLIPPTETSERQHIGHDAETFLAQVFTRRTGLHIAGQQLWCEHPLHPWARCTVDGLVYEHPDPTPDAELGTAQFKTDARRNWHNITDPINGIPAAIEAQCQWEMGVRQVEHCWLVVGFSGWNIDIFEIEHRPDDFAYMLDVAGRFWCDHVLTGAPPEPDGSDATSAAIAAVWPHHSEGETVAVDDLAELLTERGELKDLIANRERRVKEIDNLLKARLGDAEIGTLDGRPHLTYRTVERKGYTVEPSTHRQLRTIPNKEHNR